MDRVGVWFYDNNRGLKPTATKPINSTDLGFVWCGMVFFPVCRGVHPRLETINPMDCGGKVVDVIDP